MNVFYSYIRTNLEYPKAAKKLNQQGKVFLSFVIDKKGQITYAQVVRGVGFSLDREALRILRESPNWHSGKQRGRAVRQKMVFPINFRL